MWHQAWIIIVFTGDKQNRGRGIAGEGGGGLRVRRKEETPGN